MNEAIIKKEEVAGREVGRYLPFSLRMFAVLCRR